MAEGHVKENASGNAEADGAPVGYRGMTVGAARQALARSLERSGIDTAMIDARKLLAHAIGTEPARLAIETSRTLTAGEAERLSKSEAERLSGRTVARITGGRAFHGIDLGVSDQVLEPRDDTGALVELALGFLRAACDERGAATLWDVGTGTGAVGLALLAAEPRARAILSDVSIPAIDLATANAGRLGLLERVRFATCDLLNIGSDERCDLLVSNPPYIPTADIPSLGTEVRRDPLAALDGGEDGLRFYRMLAEQGAARLNAQGALAVEIGAGQGPDVRAIMATNGWRFAGSMSDLGGQERALAFRPVD